MCTEIKKTLWQDLGDPRWQTPCLNLGSHSVYLSGAVQRSWSCFLISCPCQHCIQQPSQEKHAVQLSCEHHLRSWALREGKDCLSLLLMTGGDTFHSFSLISEFSHGYGVQYSWQQTSGWPRWWSVPKFPSLQLAGEELLSVQIQYHPCHNIKLLAHKKGGWSDSSCSLGVVCGQLTALRVWAKPETMSTP